ncbi:MAG: hypothetical protein AB7O73_06175 [Bacteroidia bacterium]
MKLPIESWIYERNYGTNIRRLFSEAVSSYKNNANRASLLFSYIGFLTIVKEAIIKAQRPSDFAEVEWNDLINKITNDDTWEKEVYELLIRSRKPVFNLTEDLKQQIRYWKDRRNDCAHFKYNEIESHHSESFWSFIRSNVPKITVEGGMESLLNKFGEHFDETKTPPGTDFTPLVKEITNSVLTTEKEDFFDKLKLRVDGRAFWRGDSNTFQIYSRILEASDGGTKEALISYLKAIKKDVEFLGAHPDKIYHFEFTHTEIRNLWKERIFDRSINPFNIYCNLLRNNLIPSEQIDEANSEIFNHFTQDGFYYYPEQADIEVLKLNGFLTKIKQIAFDERKLDGYKWVNGKCDLIMCFIENVPLEKDVVQLICEMASRYNHSQWLVRELNSAFDRNSELKISFQNIASVNGISIPPNLK